MCSIQFLGRAAVAAACKARVGQGQQTVNAAVEQELGEQGRRQEIAANQTLVAAALRSFSSRIVCSRSASACEHMLHFRSHLEEGEREGGGGRGKGKKGHAARDCGRWNLSSSSRALFFFSNLALTCRFGSLTKIEGRIQRRACGAKGHMKP